MDKEKYEQTDRWTKQKDVKISKWRDRQTNRKTDQQTDLWVDGITKKTQTDIRMYRQTDRQKNKQRDREEDRHSDRHTKPDICCLKLIESVVKDNSKIKSNLTCISYNYGK